MYILLIVPSVFLSLYFWRISRYFILSFVIILFILLTYMLTRGQKVDATHHWVNINLIVLLNWSQVCVLPFIFSIVNICLLVYLFKIKASDNNVG